LTVRSWFSDPIYFDPQPNAAWVNANELLEAGRKHEVFLADRQTLNLYPILVRRSDFLRRNASDRVLARFPFLRLTPEERDAFSQQELLVAERLRDYFYRSVDRRILEWRSLLHHYLEERGGVPLPFLRCLPAAVPAATSLFSLEGRTFESARGESFTMPSNLTSELAYLCGVINGDGSLTRYVLNIIDYSLAHIRQLRERFSRLFGQTGRIQQQSKTSPALIITNLWVVRLFSFLTGQPIGGKKYAALREPLLFRDEPLRSFYWSGVMDADGSYARRNVTLTSVSKAFVSDFVSYLESLAISPKTTYRNDGTYQVYIPRQFHARLKSQLISFHPEKRLQFLRLKKGRSIRPERKYRFLHFNHHALVNGYFNFRMMTDIHITGLGSFVKKVRGTATQMDFAQQLGINVKTLRLIEANRSTLELALLEHLLLLANKSSLMPFLTSFGRRIQFRRGRAPPVFLDYQPTAQLKSFVKKMTFYDSYIRLNSNDQKLLLLIAEHFGLPQETGLIRNGTLRYFFKTYCHFTQFK